MMMSADLPRRFTGTTGHVDTEIVATVDGPTMDGNTSDNALQSVTQLLASAFGPVTVIDRGFGSYVYVDASVAAAARELVRSVAAANDLVHVWEPK